MTAATRPLSCPLCGDRDPRLLKRFADGVEVGKCRSCGLAYTPRAHPAPHTVLGNAPYEVLRRRYADILEGRIAHVRQPNYDEYLRRIRRYLPRDSRLDLLDVGCAHGLFGRTARDAGFRVTGLEPNPGMARLASDDVGLEVLQGRLEEVDLSGRMWDVITFTDALEYLPDPLAPLRRLVDHLRPGGILFLKVPNADYFRLRRRFEGDGDDPATGAFSPSSRAVHYRTRDLRRLATVMGLEVLEVGAPDPVNPPAAAAGSEGWSEDASPWYRGLIGKAGRRILNQAGRLEAALTGGSNHLSPSLHLVGRKPESAML